MSTAPEVLRPKIDPIRDATGYDKRTRGGREAFINGCYLCGREVKNPEAAQLVAVDNSGEIMAPADYNEGDWQHNSGLHYVGSECARKYVKGWTLPPGTK